MSKLKELIEKFCPNGVEYQKLDDILDYEQPTQYIVKSRLRFCIARIELFVK